MDHLQLHRTRETVLSSARAPSEAPRSTIAASWRRVAAVGLDPGSHPEVPPLTESELAARRARSGLAHLVPRLDSLLSSVIDAGQMVVLADPEGRVLWRAGSSRVRRMADDLGFVGGSAWTEGNVGTNAIGTCLVLDAAVHIQGPEHFVESHTRWGCAAAPIRDPWTDRTVGVLDVSGPSRGMHPAELALVEAVAQLTSLELALHHQAQLDQFRAVAAPVLARLHGDVVAVDHHGHLAAAIGTRAPARVALPQPLRAGRIWLPNLGAAYAEPLAGGWLVHLSPVGDEVAMSVEIDLRCEQVLRVDGPSGSWSRRLTPRHAEIVLALADAGAAGRSAAQLADDLFADSGRQVTVRSEMSRLRRSLGSVLLSGPYRFATHATVTVRLPEVAGNLLPGASSPIAVRYRARLPNQVAHHP